MEIHEWVVSFLVAAAVFADLRHHRIPNCLTVTGALGGVAVNVLAHGPAEGFRLAVAGLAMGVLVSLPFFALGGMGGGDVKLLGSIGAFLGPRRVFGVFLFAALAGGILSLFLLLIGGRFSGFRKVLGDLIQFTLAGGRVEPEKDGVALRYSLPIAAGAFFEFILGGLLWEP